MSAIEFEPWPKIARLNRGITVTEKIDGTNAAIVITSVPGSVVQLPENAISGWYDPERDATIHVYAQSRSRFITPGKATDNYGFAGWVHANAEALVKVLGEGAHFGEWWGGGIQRGYGLKGGDKRFSLFNTRRWNYMTLPHTSPFDRENFSDRPVRSGIEGLDVVPVLHEGQYSQEAIDAALDQLRASGSDASNNGAEAEGVVVFMHASRTMYKVTLKGDEAPKGAAGHALDQERIAA